MLTRRAFVALSTSLFAPTAVLAAGAPDRMLGFFTGRVAGEGVFSDLRKGKTRGVKAVLSGRRGRDSLTLTQDLNFSDGQREHRVWIFTTSGRRIVGRREDLIGEAEIDVADSSARIAYTARTNVDGSTYDLRFDENLSFAGTRSATSIVKIKLLFIPVAEMRLRLRKLA